MSLVFTGCRADNSLPEDKASPSAAEPSVVEASTVPVDDLPQIRSEADLEIGRAFPLDSYALTGTQIDLINQAAYLLESKCLTEKGFTLPPWTPRPDIASQNRLVVKFGLGLLSEARQYGYDVSPEYLEPEKKTTADPPSQQYSEALADALLGPVADRPDLPPLEIDGGQFSVGVPYTPDSCMGIAYNDLDISLARSQELSMWMGSAVVVKIDVESQDRAAADPRMIQVIDDWSACMAAHGFITPNPVEASLTYGPADKATAIAAATADVQCKYDTNYFGVRFGVTVACQQQLIEQQSAELETLAASNRDILNRANAAIEAD